MPFKRDHSRRIEISMWLLLTVLIIIAAQLAETAIAQDLGYLAALGSFIMALVVIMGGFIPPKE